MNTGIGIVLLLSEKGSAEGGLGVFFQDEGLSLTIGTRCIGRAANHFKENMRTLKSARQGQSVSLLPYNVGSELEINADPGTMGTKSGRVEI